MIITLYNFRCYYGKHSIKIDDTNITLLSGESGKGKTSILMAFYFAITGSAPLKVISDGCDSCWVEVEFVNIKNSDQCTIHRSKRPNKVSIKVNDVILDEQFAQNYINRYFGKHFEITSYIQQQYYKSFLFLSPSEKLDILEKLCFLKDLKDSEEDDEFNPEHLKQKCLDNYKEINHKLLQIKGEYNIIDNLCKNIITEPEPLMESQDLGRLEELQKKLQDIEKNINMFHSRATLDENIKDISNQIETNKKLLKNSDDLPPYDESTLKEQLHNMKMIKELELLILTTPKSFQDYTKEDCMIMFDEYKLNIQKMKEYNTLLTKLKDHKHNKHNLTRLHDKRKEISRTSEGIYNCPSCKSVLTLMDKQLHINHKNISDTIDPKEKEELLRDIDSQIEKLTKITNVQDEYKIQLDKLSEDLDEDVDLDELLEEYSNLENYYRKNCDLEIKNQHNQERLESIIRKQIVINLDEKDINKYINIMNEQKNINERLVFLERQKENYQKQLNTYQLEKDINTYLSQKEYYLSEINNIKEFKYKYQIYSIKKKEYEEYITNLQKSKDYKKQILSLEEKLENISELKKIILKTESDIIQRRTRNISDLVNVYISQMFSEPIQINLYTTKKTNTNNEKVQIQLEVFYKNMKCDIGILSGGEQARLNLAFILAFAYLWETPILLLDECTSNLDQNLTEVVLEHISNVGIPKIILIAHQVIEGNFTQILKL